MKYIHCPYCNYEYHPAEILYPTSVVGKFDCIVRDEDNQIERVISDTTDLEETYCCDRCGNKFSVKIDMNFEVSKVKTIDFESDFVSSLHKS